MSCTQCFTGHVKAAKPKGSTATVHGRKTYVAQPSDPSAVKGVIVIIPDAFGWEFVNNRVLADRYASLGNFKVYLPEFMDETACPLWMMDVFAKLTKKTKSVLEYLQLPYYVVLAMRGFIPFLVRNRESISMPKVQTYFEAIRASEEVSLPVGAAGFCWGGLHALKLASGMSMRDGKPLVDAVFTAHPSNADIPGDFRNVRKPTSLAIGNRDIMLPPAKMRHVEEIWEELDGVETEIVGYPGAGHGFSVRADPLNAHQEKQSREAELQAVRWFEKHFGVVSS